MIGRRLRVADRLERDGARGVDVLVDEVGRHLQGGRVVVEVALDVVVGQQRLRVDVEPDQIADGVRVLAAIEAAQRHTSRCGGTVLSCRSRSRATRRTRPPTDCPGAWRQPAASGHRAACGSLSRQSRRADRGVQIQPGQRQAAGLDPLAVAADAVLIDQRLLRGNRRLDRRTRRGGGRRLPLCDRSARWQAPAGDPRGVHAPQPRDRGSPRRRQDGQRRDCGSHPSAHLVQTQYIMRSLARDSAPAQDQCMRLCPWNLWLAADEPVREGPHPPV